MPRHPDFITKTSHLSDSEAEQLIAELEAQVLDGKPLATHFRNVQGAHCFNVNPQRQAEWDRFWGMWKSHFFQQRLAETK